MYPKWYMSWHSLFISIESCFPHILRPSLLISNLASLQLQIRLKVHHLCPTVWDTKYPNLQNRTLLNKWLSLMECKKWRSKITSKLQTCHMKMFVSLLSPPVSIFDGSDASFLFSPGSKDVEFWGVVVFHFSSCKLVRNMTQIIIRGFVLSRFSMIFWFRQHVAATVTGHRYEYKGTYRIQDTGERIQDTCTFFLNKTHTPKLVWFVYKIIRDFINEDIQRFSASVSSSQINAALKWVHVIVRHFEDIG